jgi:putative redox protein
MEPLFRSGPHQLAGHLATPRTAPGTRVPGVVISHPFPTVQRGKRNSGLTFPELADRIANEMGWYALAYNFRGCGRSEGDFSLRGWLDDLLAAAAFVRSQPEVRGVWLVGFGTGGALSVCAAAQDPSVRGVAVAASPADFDDWASHPRRLLQHARDLGIVSTPSFPTSFDAWSRELRDLRPVACAAELAPRSMLVLHGGDDDVVPVFDARVVADAHGDADLRIVDGGAHQLRHDPRAVAILLGWLDRQRNQAVASRTPG